jgi:hypothetical protein
MKCSPGGPALLCFLAASLHAATIEGTVTDAAGRPLENARIEHTGKMVVATSTSLALRPSADEIRTDASGHFRVDTDKPAFVVRKPGYQSIRVMVANDAKIVVTLSVVASPSRCRLPAVPSFKTKAASDVDYQATWYYIGPEAGQRGFIAGTGPTYSLGAPSDSDVWTSPQFSEFVDDSGVIDAAGRSADGTYWRKKSIFGSAARYYSQTREIAEQLDCVMDRVPIHPE